MTIDFLRFPSPFDPEIDAYKDWLHLNIFDHNSGIVGLINTSLHGSPLNMRSRAIGTALVHFPDVGWIGNMEICGINEANLALSSIGLPKTAFATNPSTNMVYVAANLPDDLFSLEAVAFAITPPIEVNQRIPFGPGWMSWHSVPILRVDGTLTFGALELDLHDASAYHDHNWGRWHWGNDLGWEWGVFISPGQGPTFILTRITDREHIQHTISRLVYQEGWYRKTFFESSIQVDFHGQLETRLRRIPGPLAALHQDRIHPSLPAMVQISADDGENHVYIEFKSRAAAQVIAGDPIKRGYGFIQEIAGMFSAYGQVDETEIASSGLAVMEYVN